MASGFPVRELGFGVQIPMPTRAEAGSRGLLKRSLTEMERQQQQQQQMQMQHAHFLRSVRQRTLLAPHASSHLSPPLLPIVLSSGSSSSSVSANLTASGLAQPQEHSSVPQAAGTGVERMRDRLQELERRLLLDEEEEEEAEVSASSSAVTTAEWSDAMQQIITPHAPVPTPLSSSPTSSSSSTVSSSVSCSPPSTSTATAAAASSSRQMLLDTAAAIADCNLETATANLAVLNRVANSRGDAEQRLTAMMVGALLSRLNPAQAESTSLPIAALCSGEHFTAAQMLYELSPCFKLGLVAANLAILEATKDQSRIHILDFSLGQGGQYAALLHVLAERHRFQPAVCPPALRITVVADPSSPFTNANSSGNLRAVGDRIEKLAERAGLEVSASSSAVTTAEWSDAMQQIITPHAPVPTPLSSSPTSSSSSTVSSSVSCSPPSTSTATAAAASSSRQMLLDTAAAIADCNLETATANLAVLNRVANSRGDAEQRLTAMMVGALLSRLNPAQAESTSLPIAALCSGEHFTAAQMLYELSPCFKLGLVAANLAILEATKDQSRIHILDFSLGQGGQYAALLHVLAERHRFQPAVCPPALRITVVADPSSPFTNANSSGNLRAVGDRIEKLAERAGLEVRFSVVHRRAAELDASILGCQPGEALAVNLAFALSRVPDESVSPANPRDELLRRVRALRPRVVALVEQDINTSTAAFAGRFAEACAHYGALLESLDATVNRDSAERARVEAGLARRAVNSVAREGMDRVERCEVFGKWRARMRMAGFESVPLGRDVIEPVKARLACVAPDHGFTIRAEAGGHGLGFGWKGRAITVASAWR
ncbi:hypothetical protein C4D60_Mb05t15340 [Musa balbisiana]|uniref:Scarecrow-like protein 8 n=1 Tax=Musa balbisiana TaxID=52838 RepID=A0A4S8JWB5_MUSBA|nr:hypothetical protein C4D60_Mb05t15340 [Musa balbisiana]